MDETIAKIHNEIPDIIKSAYEMEHPNLPVGIYDGEYTLVAKKESFKIEGKIYFDWFPKNVVKFEGMLINPSSNIIRAFDSNEDFDLEIDGLMFGRALLLRVSDAPRSKISGIVVGGSVLGDRAISVSDVNFVIPNFRYVYGDPVKEIDDNGRIQCYRSRLILENENYTITLDSSSNFDTLDKELKEKGGYVTLNMGELKKKDGSITHNELQSLIYCFSTFLTFLNGRRCAPLFLQGKYEGDVIWTDFTSYQVDQYKTVDSWMPHAPIDGLNELWREFSKMWSDPNDKDFLKSAVHWYIESNANSGYLEGSIIMTQVALELIYNWLVIEKKKLLIGRDAENISASNKIRLLLAQVNCSSEVPESLKSLKEFVNDNKEIVDGVEAFVQIRNAIIHSQEEKRKKLTNMHYKIKYEACQLSLFYIEYALLSILKYKGKSFNRCSGARWAGEGEESIRY